MNGRGIIAHAMTEAELAEHIRELCKGYGLWSYHTHDSRRSNPGWPDLVVVGQGVIYRELKRERGTVSKAQWDVGYRLLKAGQDWKIWRPSDLLSKKIHRELEAIR